MARKRRNAARSYVGNGRFGGPLVASRVGPVGLAAKRKEIEERFTCAAQGLGPDSLHLLHDLSGSTSGTQEDFTQGPLDINFEGEVQTAGDSNDDDANETRGQGAQQALDLQFDMAAF
ncbi:hypothetical protein BDP27DRAFT_1375077, partial [Rhodocollybia butyracea]